MTRRMIPCPFCGLSASLEQRVGRTAVACGQCGACGPAFDGHDEAAVNDAVSGWNTRPFEGGLLARAEAAEAALAAARVSWHDAVENFHNIDRNGEATEICEWACALRDALADAEPDWGAAGGAR